jgi:hypothetical protein
MEVRGTAVRATPLFVRQRFSDRVEEWLSALTPESRVIMGHKIDTSSWYPLSHAMIEPTQRICDLFFAGRDTGAWELGRFSGDYSLWGLYRLFVRIGSPLHLIEKATEAFTTYYRPSRLVMTEGSKFRAVAVIQQFPEPHHLVECRIGGWIQRGLEISGCQDVQLRIGRSLTRGDECTELVAEWQ